MYLLACDYESSHTVLSKRPGVSSSIRSVTHASPKKAHVTSCEDGPFHVGLCGQGRTEVR